MVLPKDIFHPEGTMELTGWILSEIGNDTNLTSPTSVQPFHWRPSMVLTPGAAITIVILGCTAFGNILVCLAIMFERRLQNMTNYFLMSLAITDLMVAVLVMPLGIITINEGYFPLPSIYCLLWVLLDVLFCTCSIMHLCIISVDRFLSLRYPIQFGRIKTKRRVVLKICLVWVLSGAMSLPLPLLYTKNEISLLRDGACYIQDPVYVTIGSIVCFYIPLIIMLVTYALTVRLLQKKEIEFRAAKSKPEDIAMYSIENANAALGTSIGIAGGSTYICSKQLAYNWKRILTKTYSSSLSTTTIEVSSPEHTASCAEMQKTDYSPKSRNKTDSATSSCASPTALHTLHNLGQLQLASSESSPVPGISARYRDRSYSSPCSTMFSTSTKPDQSRTNSFIGDQSLLQPFGSPLNVPMAQRNKEVHAIRKYSVKYRPPLRRLDLPQFSIHGNDSTQSPEDHVDPMTSAKSTILTDEGDAGASSPSSQGESDSPTCSATAAVAKNVMMVLAANGGTGSSFRTVLPSTSDDHQKATSSTKVAAADSAMQLDEVSIEPDSFSTTTTTSQSFHDPAGSVGSRHGCGGGSTHNYGGDSASSSGSPFYRSSSSRSFVPSRSTSVYKSTSRHSGGRFLRAEKKATKVLGVVFFTFVGLWAPFFLLNLLSTCPTCYIDPTIQDTALWLGYASSMVNPIFYTVFNKTFRQTFIRILQCRWKEIGKKR